MASRNSPLNPRVHFDNFRSWLDLEGKAEQQRMESRRNRLTPAEAERNGSTLLNMVITSHTTGLGGRYLLTLQKRHAPERLVGSAGRIDGIQQNLGRQTPDVVMRIETTIVSVFG